jgi:cell division protein FtsL
MADSSYDPKNVRKNQNNSEDSFNAVLARAMKRKALAIVLIVIIALSISTWFVYSQTSDLQNQISELQEQNEELQDQISELQNQLSNLQEVIGNVEITALSVEGWLNPGGLLYVRPFNVTIQNNGTHDVYGVTLTCKITGNQSDLFYNFYYVDPLTKTLDVLHGGELRLMRIFLETGLALISKFSGCRLVVTLTLGDVVLDEWVQVI